jgi:hypothetical protein
MSGRGDNNKHGSAGRGASNQSNQPFISDGEKQPRSNHNKTKAKGKSSLEQERLMDENSHRDTGAVTNNPGSVRTTSQRTLNLVVDDVPYVVKASPFSFNEEIRYYVSVNGGTEHVFTWDSELKILRAIDDDAATIPNALEEAISERLQSKE